MMAAMLRILILALFLSLPLKASYPPEIEEAQVETYRSIGELDLKVWILGQGDQAKPKPAVVLFFGGGWRFGSPTDLLRHARFLADRGLVCLLADYRVANRHGTRIADCVVDAKAAVAWTRQNAARLGIDPQRIGAGGASAGGHLAACAALVPGFGSEEKPNALMLFNPVLIMSPFEGEDFGVKQRLTAQIAGAEPESLSPMHHVDGKAPPTWIAHGTLDGLVPIKTAKAFRDHMKAQGAICELLEAALMPHAFHYHDPWFTKTMASAEGFFTGLGWMQKR